MSLAPPLVAELATFSGRDSSTFNSFAPEALSQATLLFYFATGLDEYPVNTEEAKLAKYGIMDMAEKIYDAQPYKAASASPFQSETIGSYSYSKLVKSIKKGDNTEVMWFDLAVSKLKGQGSGIASSGSIQGMEWEGLAVDENGRAKILGASGNYVTGSAAWEIDTAAEVIHNHPIL